MTAANVIRLPVSLDRIVALDRAANIAAELDEARGAMRFPTYYTDDELLGYCATLLTHGDRTDCQRADQMIHAINRRAASSKPVQPELPMADLGRVLALLALAAVSGIALGALSWLEPMAWLVGAR